MSRKLPAHGIAVASGIACLVSMGTVHADIIVEEKIVVEGAGIMAMANMSGTTVTSISGDRARVDNDIQMQSRMVRMFARDAGQNTQIIRLDQDKVYDLNLKKKQYTETSLAEQRAQMAKAMEQAQQTQAKQPAPSGMDEQQCEWSEPKADVKKTGAKATVAGFNAEQITIVASQSCKDKKSGAVCDFALMLDEWLAPGFDGGTERTRFYQSYAQKMGFTPTVSRDATERAEQMFGRYKGMWSEVAKKMNGVKGYPVRVSFSLGFGGPQCKTAESSTASLPPAPGPGELGAAAATGAGQMAGEAAASKVGGSALGGFAGQIGGKIAGSLFKRRQQQQEQAEVEPVADSGSAAAPGVSENGMITPLRVSSELVSVRKDSVEAGAFEVPAEFKQVASGT